jgi:hypothetical protein
MDSLQNEGAPVKAADKNLDRLVDTSDFDSLYADLRQVALDMAATWLGHYQRRAARIQRHLDKTGSVSDAILNAATDEGQSILRYLSAIGRCR